MSSTETATLNLGGDFEARAAAGAAAGDKLTTSLDGIAAASAKAAGGRVPMAGPVPAGGKAPVASAAPKAPTKAAGKVAPTEVTASGNKSAKYAAKEFGVSKAAMRAPVTAAIFDATKLALGLRGMAQLDAIGQRASMNLRTLFRGVDPTPAIRGFDRFASTALSPAGATGKALEGIFKRTFNSIFGDVEKLANPMASMFQGAVIAALYAEGAWLDARLALFPLQQAVSDVIGPIDGMKTAAYAGGAALGVMAYAAAGVAAPFIAAAAAMTLAYTQWQKLKAEMGAGGAQAVERSKLTVGSKEAEGAYGIKSVDAAEADAVHAKFLVSRAAAPTSAGGAVPPAAPAPANAAGKVTGAAYAEGLAGGLGAGAPGVAAAAGALAGVIDPKVRAVTETHSPSRKAFATGEEQPAGLAGGIRSGIPDVSRAAGDMGAASNAGSRGSSSSGGQGSVAMSSGPLELHFHFPGIISGKASELREAGASFAGELRGILVGLGVPVVIR